MLPFLTAPQRAAAFSGPDFGYAELDIPARQRRVCRQFSQRTRLRASRLQRLIRRHCEISRSRACLMCEASSASITHAQVIAIWVKVIRDSDSRGHLCPAAFAIRTFHFSTSAASRRGMDLSWTFFRWHSRSIQPPWTVVNIRVGHNRACFSTRSRRVSSQVTHGHGDQTVHLREYFDVHSWPTALVGFCFPRVNGAQHTSDGGRNKLLHQGGRPVLAQHARAGSHYRAPRVATQELKTYHATRADAAAR